MATTCTYSQYSKCFCGYSFVSDLRMADKFNFCIRLSVLANTPASTNTSVQSSGCQIDAKPNIRTFSEREPEIKKKRSGNRIAACASNPVILFHVPKISHANATVNTLDDPRIVRFFAITFVQYLIFWSDDRIRITYFVKLVEPFSACALWTMPMRLECLCFLVYNTDWNHMEAFDNEPRFQ